MPLIRSVQYQNKSFRLLDLSKKHPTGNKFFKLKDNLARAKKEGAKTLLSFGGAWSNHLHALATVGAEQGFSTIGVVRGERPANLSAMLLDAKSRGMHLHFVSRSDYRNRDTSEYQEGLRRELGDFFLIPEGGSNEAGVKGAEDIVDLLEGQSFGQLIVPVGTGGTLAGIVNRLPTDKSVYGVCVLKGADYLDQQVKDWTRGRANWSIDHGGHCGGYAKCPDELRQFILDFEASTGIELEPVYTAKMIYRLLQLMDSEEGSFSDVIAIHTGGLQGRRGFDF